MSELVREQVSQPMVIEAKGVRARWRQSVVLDDVSCGIARGQVLGLIGPPAAGKTTLLKVLAGLLPIDAGAIQLDGTRVDTLPPSHRGPWFSQLGMSFQNNALFDTLTVFDNVAFPLRTRGVDEAQVRERVTERLDQVGLGAAAQSLPKELSGGMQKRVGIARATVAVPTVGLFDDPVAGLDPQSAAMILDLITGLCTQLSMATVIVSNDLPVLLPLCSQVVMLVGGRVAYAGPTAGLESSERAEVVQFVTGADEGPL